MTALARKSMAKVNLMMSHTISMMMNTMWNMLMSFAVIA